MKTSNKLLTGLILLTLLAMLGTNLEIKAEYNKIKPNDLFYDYSIQPVKSFKTIILIGNLHGYVEIQPGNSNEVRIKKDQKDLIKQTISGDTLKITYLEKERNKYPDTDLENVRRPTIYIEVQQLASVSIKDIPCKIKGWHTDQLHLFSDGGVTLLDSNTIQNLTASFQKGGRLHIDKSNVLGHTDIKIKDSSWFNTQNNIFASLNLDVDSTAHLSLSGDLLKILLKK